MTDKVLNVGVGLNVKTVHKDAAGNGDLRKVVAHEVDQHAVLSTFFFILDHPASKPSCLGIVMALRAGAFDR